jgi:hypothetical protein
MLRDAARGMLHERRLGWSPAPPVLLPLRSAARCRTRSIRWAARVCLECDDDVQGSRRHWANRRDRSGLAGRTFPARRIGKARRAPSAPSEWKRHVFHCMARWAARGPPSPQVGRLTGRTRNRTLVWYEQHKLDALSEPVLITPTIVGGFIDMAARGIARHFRDWRGQPVSAGA